MPELGIIADDVTGALLVAGELEAAGIGTPVAFLPAAIGNDEPDPVLVLAVRSRICPAEQALERIAQAAGALERAGCGRLAYKACASFDSTEEGNIGPAADHLSHRAGDAPVLMSAGFPAFDCTVHQGYLFYRGRLVSESPKRLDPLTPMPDPDLVRFLSRQCRSPVRLLPHRVLAQGVAAASAVWELLRAAGARHVLADTTDDGDVAVTVALMRGSAAAVVASDPAIIGLARALAGSRCQRRPPPALPRGPGAVLVGSVGPTATAQVDHLAAVRPVLRLDLCDPRPDAAVVAEALDWAAPRMGAGAVGLATTADPAGVAQAQAALGRAGAAARAEGLMAGIAAGLRDRGLCRLVVSGGETSGAVVAALGIGRVRALPAGPLGSGFCVAEGARPLALFLKSGKLGTDDALLRGLEALEPGG